MGQEADTVSAANVVRCVVRVTDGHGVTHVAEIQDANMYTAAARALMQLRQEGWLEGVAPTTRLQVEFHTSGFYQMPLSTLEHWASGDLPR
jgi:hypothetical protein